MNLNPVFQVYIGKMAIPKHAQGISRFPVLPPIKSEEAELEEISAAKEVLEKHLKLYQKLQNHSRKNVQRQHLKMSLYVFWFVFKFHYR